MIMMTNDHEGLSCRNITGGPAGKANLFFILLLVFPAGGLTAQIDPAVHTGKMLDEYRSTGNDSLKIEKLRELAFFYCDYLDENNVADSIGEIAIQIAEKSHRPELLFLAYCGYVESNDLHEFYQKALDYALKAEQISFIGKTSSDIFRNYKDIVSVYISGYEFDKALEYSYKLLSLAGAYDNSAMKTESYLCIGQCLEGKNQKIEAFRNYLNAVSLADRTRNSRLQRECYSRLSNFYNFNKLYNKATHYKLLERELVKNDPPVDSAALMWIEYDLQVIDINSDHNKLYESNMNSILHFASRNQHKRMLSYEIALIRTHYIEANEIGKLHELYYEKYPMEMTRLISENPGLYYRLKAFFCEYEHKPDSALFYFNKAEKILTSDQNKILQSNFYNRFGQFLARHGYQKRAIASFSKSLELARTVFYIDYMLGAVKQLESLYARGGDYKNAFNYSVLNKILNDSINNNSKKEQLLVIEIDHETRQRELFAEQEKQETIKRHYLQYSAMTIGIFSVFIILIMLGSMKVPEWIIRMLGFFSFIFLFEFIVLLADNKIHDITHGEPWKVLLIKIGLIAFLLPLHHTIEKRVIAYLLNHKLLDISKYSVVLRIREQVDRWTSGRADRRTSGQVNRRTSGQADK